MTVKGRIGQEEVELEDAATESTLLKILAAMERGGGSGGGGGKDQAQAKKNLVAMAQQTNKTTKSLDELEEQAEETGNALMRGFGHLKQGFSNMAMEFLSGSDRLSEFSSHVTGVISNIPIIGGALGGTMQLFVSVIDQNIDAFRELSGVGIDLGDSLLSARQASARAGLSLETFNQVVTQNSTGLALFAGSASEGAKRFSQISGIVQKSMGPTFSKLGMTMEETAEYTAEYLELQTRLGRAQTMSNKDLATGVSTTVMEIDKLARVTGKRRDQLLKEMQENLTDKRISLFMSTLDEAAQANVNGVLQMVGENSPMMKDAITEMIATGGVPVGDFGKSLVRLNPNLGTMAAGLADGSVTQAEYMAEVRKTAESVANMSEEEKKLAGLLAAQGNETMAATIEMQKMRNAGAGLTEVQLAQKEAEKTRNKELADFERQIQQVKNAIMDALIKTGIFDAVEKGLAALVGAFGGEKGVAGLEKALTPFTNWIGAFIKELEAAENPMDVIKKYLKDGLSKLGGMIKPMIASAFSGLGSMIMGAIFGGGDDATTTEETPGESGSETKGKGSGGIFVGLDSALEKLAGLVVAGGAVYLAIKGFQMLLGGFANPTVILGAGVLAGLLIGTGAAIKLAGDGISAAGDGVNKMAEGVERMSQVKDTANLKDVASALGDLGSAMLSLSAGGVIDSIMSFFGAKSPFDKMVDGINKFSNIDANSISNLTGASSGLANLRAFTDGLEPDNVKKYASAIEDLADAMKELNEALADQNKGRKESGFAVADMLKSGSLGGGGGLSSSDMTQLIDLMRENNRLTGRILANSGPDIY